MHTPGPRKPFVSATLGGFLDTAIAYAYRLAVDYSLWLAIAALALAVFAVGRAYVPPQTRALLMLTGRVEDLEAAHEDVRERLTRRAKIENVSKARDEKELRAARRDSLEAEALQVLAAARAGTPPAAPSPPPDPATARAQLRAKFLTRH